MTQDSAVCPAGASTEEIEAGLVEFLEQRLKTEIPVDRDLFATGVVSSIFAMELVVHLEQTYSIAILGSDLRIVNVRTVQSMTAMVQRLRNADSAADA